MLFVDKHPSATEAADAISPFTNSICLSNVAFVLPLTMAFRSLLLGGGGEGFSVVKWQCVLPGTRHKYHLSFYQSSIGSKFIYFYNFRTQLKLETLDDAYVSRDQEDLLTDKHGCPAYVSPEILESTNGYSGRAADIWSLGVMLYTMLFGRYPFHDNEPSALFSKIRSGHFILPDCISSKARCLLRSILRKDPSERLTAQELLEHPWFYAQFQTATSTRFERRFIDQCVPDVEDNKPVIE